MGKPQKFNAARIKACLLFPRLIISTAIIMICFMPIPANSASAGGQWAECNRLLEKKEYSKVDELLKEWKKTSPDDPEWYVCSSNVLYAQAEGLVIQAGKGGPDALKLTDPSTGKEVGFLGSGYEPQKMEEAIKILQEGAGRFPLRLDIHFGLAHICQENGDFNCQYDAIVNALRIVKNNPGKMLWMENKPLPDTENKFVPRSMHGYASYYWSLENDEGDKRFLKIVQLGLEYYPDNLFLLNDLGVYWAIKGEWTKALDNFKKSSEVNPEDSLVLNNVAECYIKTGDVKNALVYLRKVVSLNNNPEQVEVAREKLAQYEKSDVK
ncbi:MAG: hypothetical protein OHK006_13720 [Thermodesulfovibrionales bacterium]